MAVNFRLFNCDRTFNLDKVEALIQRVAENISRQIKIEKTYFPLPRMKELCEELEKGDGSHFEYAVFVVHAHESRLSINEKNAGIGYAKVYRALQKVTDDQVLVVIGGDDNYKGQEERDKSVLSRWAWLKICSQFTEDYVNGIKSFIFSWEENHHPIHEEALEFYLNPMKKGTKFEPRPRPPPAKAPEKKEAKKMIEQPKALEGNRQEKQHMETEKPPEKGQTYQDPLNVLSKQEPNPMEKQVLEKEFPPENNENRNLPLSEPENQRINRELQNLSQQHPIDSFQSKTIAYKQYQTTRGLHTQPADVPMKRRFYKASISYGRVVEVLEQEPPGWKPSSRDLDDLLAKKQSYKKAIIEFWDEGNGKVQAIVHPNEAKLCKIAEGFASDRMHSIVVYSYHDEEGINNQVSNFIHHSHSGVTELSSCQPIEPASLLADIMCAKPDYVMFSADIGILEDEGQVNTVMREYGAKIKDIITRFVGKGVIILLFGDVNYTTKGDLSSQKAKQDVRKLIQDIVPRGRLSVLTCRDRLYTTHQEWMKQTLTSRGAAQSANEEVGSSGPSSKQHYYSAHIMGDQVIEVLDCIPPGWKPDEDMVKKKLKENSDKDRKAYLEIVGNERGEILKIAVEKESKGPIYYARNAKKYISSFFGGGKQSDEPGYV